MRGAVPKRTIRTDGRTARKLKSFAPDVCGRTALMRCDVMEAPAQALHSSAYGVCSCVCVCVCVCA